MNKATRLKEITKLVESVGTIRIADIMNTLKVSDMTLRRDLTELEAQGILTRIHGGAKSNRSLTFKEMSHEEKHFQHMEEKRKVAKQAVTLIDEGDTIFLGPGTTIELLAEEIHHSSIRVITNCLPIFNSLYKKKSETFKVFLIGGEMREVTQAFIGDMTNVIMEKMFFTKMFFSGNGVKNGLVMTSSFEEAYTQRLALSKSEKSYLLVDTSKLGKEDFTSICEIKDLTAVVIDKDGESTSKELLPYANVLYK